MSKMGKVPQSGIVGNGRRPEAGSCLLPAVLMPAVLMPAPRMRYSWMIDKMLPEGSVNHAMGGPSSR
jgi:hypothetical protein